MATSSSRCAFESVSFLIASPKALEMTQILGFGQVSVPKTISESRGRKSYESLGHGAPWNGGKVQLYMN